MKSISELSTELTPLNGVADFTVNKLIDGSWKSFKIKAQPISNFIDSGSAVINPVFVYNNKNCVSLYAITPYHNTRVYYRTTTTGTWTQGSMLNVPIPTGYQAKKTYTVYFKVEAPGYPTVGEDNSLGYQITVKPAFEEDYEGKFLISKSEEVSATFTISKAAYINAVKFDAYITHSDDVSRADSTDYVAIYKNNTLVNKDTGDSCSLDEYFDVSSGDVIKFCAYYRYGVNYSFYQIYNCYALNYTWTGSQL